MRLIGPDCVSRLQRIGPKCFVNTMTTLRKSHQYCKYLVVTEEDFSDELTNWGSLYFSGRLHKPVRLLATKGLSAEKMDFWETIFRRNHENALKTALLLLPVHFSLRKLFQTICGISYNGDIRMKYAERPDKVEYLSDESCIDLFRIYHQLIFQHDLIVSDETLVAQASSILAKEDDDEASKILLRKMLLSPNFIIKQSTSESFREGIFEQLPLNLQFNASAIATRSVRLSKPWECQNIDKALQGVVRRSSTLMLIKNAITAGPVRSVAYGMRKVGRRIGLG